MREKIVGLIKETLPEFGQAMGKRAYRGGRRVNLIRERSDLLFERLLVEFDSERDGQAVALQQSISFFPECPIPSGPFGYDAPLTHVVAGGVRAQLLKYWYGTEWYEVKISDKKPELFFDLFQDALAECVRPTLNDWADKLLADDLLQNCCGKLLGDGKREEKFG